MKNDGSRFVYQAGNLERSTARLDQLFHDSEMYRYFRVAGRKKVEADFNQITKTGKFKDAFAVEQEAR